MNAPISMDKQYRTQDGRDVRVLCVDAPGLYPVVGYFLQETGIAEWTWTRDGRCRDLGDWRLSCLDLIEVQPVETTWHNVYPGGDISPVGYVTRERADQVVYVTRTHVLRKDYDPNTGDLKVSVEKQ